MSGDQEPWVFRGGLTSDLQVFRFKRVGPEGALRQTNIFIFILATATFGINS